MTLNRFTNLANILQNLHPFLEKSTMTVAVEANSYESEYKYEYPAKKSQRVKGATFLPQDVYSQRSLWE